MHGTALFFYRTGSSRDTAAGPRLATSKNSIGATLKFSPITCRTDSEGSARPLIHISHACRRMLIYFDLLDPFPPFMNEDAVRSTKVPSWPSFLRLRTHCACSSPDLRPEVPLRRCMSVGASSGTTSGMTRRGSPEYFPWSPTASTYGA
jgi:hypothetical protein